MQKSTFILSDYKQNLALHYLNQMKQKALDYVLQ